MDATDRVGILESIEKHIVGFDLFNRFVDNKGKKENFQTQYSITSDSLKKNLFSLKNN